MNWNKFIYGSYSIKRVLEAVQDPDWQNLRMMMWGTSLETKYQMLEKYAQNNLTEEKKIQITNYVNALKRGGLLK